MGNCISRHDENDPKDDFIAQMLELYEEGDSLSELPIIQMKDIKRDIMMRKIQIRRQNINNIYKTELEKFYPH